MPKVAYYFWSKALKSPLVFTLNISLKARGGGLYRKPLKKGSLIKAEKYPILRQSEAEELWL